MGLCIDFTTLGRMPKAFILSRDCDVVDHVARNFLQDAHRFSNIRNMPAYSGRFQDVEVGVAGVGYGEVSAAMYVEDIVREQSPDVIIKIDLMSPIPGADMTDRMIMAQVANTTSRMNRVRYGIGTYPAAADFHLLDMACAKAADEKIAYHVGPVISVEHRDQITVAERFARVGVCAIETELNQVYTLSSKAGIPALGIGRVVEPSCDTDERPSDFKFIDELASFALQFVCKYLRTKC